MRKSAEADKHLKESERKMRQLNLLDKPSLQFGGSFDQRHRLRTLCSRKPIHLTLKSQKKFSLFKNREGIRRIIFKHAKKFGIKIYSWSIQKDHIHLAIQILSRETYRKWIRTVTGLIARLLGKGIWKFRPFTRVLSGFGRELRNLNNYIFRNEMEVFKIWKYDRDISLSELEKSTVGRIFML